MADKTYDPEESPEQEPQSGLNSREYVTHEDVSVPVIADSEVTEADEPVGPDEKVNNKKQLEQAEMEAMDKSNIIKGGRTHRASKPV